MKETILKEFRVNQQLPKIKVILLSILIFLFGNLCIFGQEYNVVRQELKLNEVIEFDLTGGEIHTYQISFRQGQVLRIDALEKGIDIRIGLNRVSDNQLVAFANFFGYGYERETLTFIVEEQGDYEIVIGSPKSLIKGKYQLTLNVKEIKTKEDEDRINAEQLLAKGQENAKKGSSTNINNAILKWNSALKIWEKLGEKYWEGYTNIFLGKVYSNLGENDKSLYYANKGLLVLKSIGDKEGEATALSNIGRIYLTFGNKVKTLFLLNQALFLFREVNDKSGEAFILNNLSRLYLSLGEKSKALDILTQVLSIRKEINHPEDEARTLTGIGVVYRELGKYENALEYYNKALNLSKAIGDPELDSAILNNIAIIYSIQNKKSEAFDYYQQALLLSKSIGNKERETGILSNIGGLFLTFGNNSKALEFFQQSLLINKAIGDKQEEFQTFSYLMILWALSKNHKTAIFYGKQAINGYQQLRGFARSSDIENATQKLFLKTLREYYAYLAELLINEKEYDLAVQVLNLYQDQQFFDFNFDSSTPVKQVALTAREQIFADRYELTAGRVTRISLQLDELKRQIGERPPTDEEKKTLESFEGELKIANEEYLKVFKDIELDFAENTRENRKENKK